MLIYEQYPESTEIFGARDIIEHGLAQNEYEFSNSDATDQSKRVDATREALGRLVEELNRLGILTPQAVARIADLDQWRVKDDGR